MPQSNIELPGEELNRLLENLSMKIERVSLLIEDAKVDPNDIIGLDTMAYNNLIICMAKYEEFLNHLHDTTQDATEDIKKIIGAPDPECYGVVDEDGDLEPADLEDEEENLE